MKRNTIYYLLLLFFTLLVQSTKFDFMSIYGIKPDLVLIFVCFVSLREGGICGTIYGFVGGIIQDLFSNGLLGASAFAKSLWGYLIGKSIKRLDTTSVVAQLTLVFFFSIFDGSLICILNWAFLSFSFFKGSFVFYIFSQALYNCIVWPFFILISGKIEKALSKG